MSTIITAIDRHSPAERAGVQVGEHITFFRSLLQGISGFTDF